MRFPRRRPSRGVRSAEDVARHEEVLEFLIEQERELLASEEGRVGGADSRTALALTAALTLAGLTVTAAGSLDRAPGWARIA